MEQTRTHSRTVQALPVPLVPRGRLPLHHPHRPSLESLQLYSRCSAQKSHIQAQSLPDACFPATASPQEKKCRLPHQLHPPCLASSQQLPRRPRDHAPHRRLGPLAQLLSAALRRVAAPLVAQSITDETDTSRPVPPCLSGRFLRVGVPHVNSTPVRRGLRVCALLADPARTTEPSTFMISGFAYGNFKVFCTNMPVQWASRRVFLWQRQWRGLPRSHHLGGRPRLSTTELV